MGRLTLEAFLQLGFQSLIWLGPFLDSRFRGNDGSRLYDLFNMTQGEFSDSFLEREYP